MPGSIMLKGWKGLDPQQHYIQQHIDIYESIDDPVYLEKEETFESWYENPIDLPGRFYLQAITQLFKQNRLAKGTFVGLGRRLDLKQINCPVYLLAGDADDITTKEQVSNAEQYVGSPRTIVSKAWSRAVILAFSWDHERSGRPGRKSRVWIVDVSTAP